MKSISVFTFRELRNFRLFHVSQKIRQNTSSEFLTSSKIVYSFFGNAEAISPAQRRRFRESQRRPQNSADFFSDVIDQTTRSKVSIFPAKRAKNIYAFSQFFTIRSLFKGIIIYTSLRTSRIQQNKQYTDTSQIPATFSIESQSALSRGNKRVNSLETTFHFLPTFIMSESIKFTKNLQSNSIFVRSFSYYKKLRESSSILNHHSIITVHLFYLKSLFYSIEGFSKIQKINNLMFFGRIA